MVKELGGTVKPAIRKAEYGRAPISIDIESDLLSKVKDQSIIINQYVRQRLETFNWHRDGWGCTENFLTFIGPFF